MSIVVSFGAADRVGPEIIGLRAAIHTDAKGKQENIILPTSTSLPPLVILYYLSSPSFFFGLDR